MMYQVYTQTEGSEPELVFSSDYDDEVISYVQEHCFDTFDLPDWPAADGEILVSGNTSEEDGCPIMWAEGRFPDGWTK